MHFISTPAFAVLAIIGATAISGASAAGCSSISREATGLIKSYGGFVASPNPKSTGQPSIGYGHFCKQKRCTDVPYRFPLSTASAEELAKTSALVKRLNDGDDPNEVAKQELPKWNKSGGEEFAGLTRRREAEVKLFQTPSPNTAFPDCSTN